MSVRKVALAKNGPALSEISLGTWRILDSPQPPSPKELANRIETSISWGITTIDTAEIYGEYSVEEAIGKALNYSKEFKKEVEIVTKCGIDVPSSEKSYATLPHYNATAENIVASAEKSLHLLGVDTIDVFLVHRPDWLTPAEETARGLTQLIESGKIKYAGVSNYTRHQFELLNHYLDNRLVTNQVEINLLAMDALYDGTLAQCEQLQIRPMAWSVLAGGQLFTNDDAAVRFRKVCDSIRDKYNGANDDAIATAWVMKHPSKPIAITGSSQLDRIKSQAQAASIDLDRQDWYALWSAAKGTTVP